ncbi:hypothetical protein CLM62_38470 [Streptomyces sp. SA15]|uniref:hypothetical protein n=1 Tax=Streptomyces sp. SA15 TaxID=934019 RepID=UPI000BAF683C|nr:hypothetical protein [Streptomyces sp. SA15]PAZ10934.1 hypothetical protein CLM62_38470 [Streptomyces sp. SA15]
MAVMSEAVVPVLEDARHAHAAVLARFRADAAVTPPGPYRQMLERQAEEVQDGLERIQHQVRDLRPRGVLDTALDVARFVSQGVMRTARLPLTIGSTLVAETLRGGRPAGARRLLLNAEDEYAAAARALASCRAGEVLAEEVHDQGTADLLGSLRRQDEELLQRLEDSLAQHARAVAASTNGFGPREDQLGGLPDAAAQAVQAAFDRARDVVQGGTRWARRAAEGAAREMPEPTRMAEEVRGAVTREQELPIPRFSQLSVDEIQQRLRPLSQSELTVIEGYERTHANRKRVLEAIEQLRGSEPWDGYAAMDPDQITARLHDVSPSVARQVLAYEQSHRRRQEVISAAQERTSG